MSAFLITAPEPAESLLRWVPMRFALPYTRRRAPRPMPGRRYTLRATDAADLRKETANNVASENNDHKIGAKQSHEGGNKRTGARVEPVRVLRAHLTAMAGLDQVHPLGQLQLALLLQVCGESCDELSRADVAQSSATGYILLWEQSQHQAQARKQRFNTRRSDRGGQKRHHAAPHTRNPGSTPKPRTQSHFNATKLESMAATSAVHAKDAPQLPPNTEGGGAAPARRRHKRWIPARCGRHVIPLRDCAVYCGVYHQWLNICRENRPLRSVTRTYGARYAHVVADRRHASHATPRSHAVETARTPHVSI